MKMAHSISPRAIMGLFIVAVLVVLPLQIMAQGGAELICEPNRGTYGLQIFLRGDGFAPNSQVQIEAFGQTIALQSDNTGQFMVIAYAPAGEAKFKPGEYTFTAKDSEGTSAETVFTLEPLTPTDEAKPKPGEPALTAKDSEGTSAETIFALEPLTLADEVIAIVTAAAEGQDIDPMLSELEKKYEDCTALSATSTPSVSEAEGGIDDWEEYVSSSGGFSVRYPSDWTIAESDSDVIVFTTSSLSPIALVIDRSGAVPVIRNIIGKQKEIEIFVEATIAGQPSERLV